MIIDVHDPCILIDDDSDGSIVSENTELFFTLPECFFCLFTLGDVFSYRLVFDNPAGIVKKGVVTPPVPLDAAIGHDNAMLYFGNRAVRYKRCKVAMDKVPVLFGNIRDESVPDNLVMLLSEMPGSTLHWQRRGFRPV